MEEWRYRKRLPLVGQPRGKLVSDAKPVDFCRGLAELAAAVRENRPCRLSAELGHPHRGTRLNTLIPGAVPIAPPKCGNSKSRGE
jgi:hypothetical protein